MFGVRHVRLAGEGLDSPVPWTLSYQYLIPSINTDKFYLRHEVLNIYFLFLY